ncbi:MAG: hypothetical protein AB1648_09870 [Pseudomonadota bacterium]
MKVQIRLATLALAATAAGADTTYILPNIPGTSVPAASQPGYAIEEIGGVTTIYRTLPGAGQLRDPKVPSYTIQRNDFDRNDPGGLNRLRREMGIDPED